MFVLPARPPTFKLKPVSANALTRSCNLLATLGALICLGSALVGCGDTQASGSVPANQSAPSVKSVKATRARISTLVETVHATGTLAPMDRAILSVKAPGRLAELLVDLGSQVEAGAPLARIEKTDYQLRLTQAQAAEAEAAAIFAEASRTLARLEKLRESGVVAEAEFETAQSTRMVASTRVQQRKAELDQAAQLLRDTEIVAPFAGVVETRGTSVGEFLNSGAPVITLVRIDPIRLRLEVPEVDAQRIQVGQEVQLVESRSSGLQASGKLVRVSPVISTNTRMLRVEADLPNPKGALRPGGFVEAAIVVNRERQALTIPPEALFSFAGLQKVVTVVDGKAKELSVKLGLKTEREVEILSGLKEGTVVVLNPGTIRTGQPLTITD